MTQADEWLPAAASSRRWEDIVLGELWAAKRRINAEAGFDPAVLHAQAQALAAAWRAERRDAGAGGTAGCAAGLRRPGPADR